MIRARGSGTATVAVTAIGVARQRLLARGVLRGTVRITFIARGGSSFSQVLPVTLRRG